MKLCSKLFACSFLIFYSVINFSCNNSSTVFRKIDRSTSGITFTNTITESDSINPIDVENMYNGGGVGIGDFNNDGLPDIYFAGNLVSNKLYINKGNFKFEDVTDKAKVGGEGKWAKGISVIDINSDGLPDIYIS